MKKIEKKSLEMNTKKNIIVHKQFIFLIITILIVAGIAIVELNKNNELYTKISQVGEKNLISEQTETTYKVNSSSGNIMNVTINIKNEIGIKEVIKPDNSSIILAGSKKQIAIDYNVEDGKEYKFKIQLVGSNEHKEYILKASLNAKPEIIQNESYLYPVLTGEGVEINKKVTINYGESKENYYSLDNGNSWIKYAEDNINIKKEGKILAKAIIDGEITKEAQEDITMQFADDAIGTDAYDENEETYFTTRKKSYMIINDDMMGKMVYITVKLSDGRYKGEISLLDENNKVIYSEASSNGIHGIYIQKGTKKLMFTPYNAWGVLDKLIEIKVDKKNEYNGNTIYVSINGNDTNGDGTQENPYATIRKAVNKANNGDKIFVTEGTYNVSLINLSSYSSVAIYDGNKKICIYGENERTILICDGTKVSVRDSAVFNLQNPNSIVRNLTVVYYPLGTSYSGSIFIRNKWKGTKRFYKDIRK